MPARPPASTKGLDAHWAKQQERSEVEDLENELRARSEYRCFRYSKEYDAQMAAQRAELEEMRRIAAARDSEKAQRERDEREYAISVVARLKLADEWARESAQPTNLERGEGGSPRPADGAMTHERQFYAHIRELQAEWHC